MKIGYSVEGRTDRALLKGLGQRWCPRAELVQGRFRGTSGVSQTREIPNTCLELQSKGAEVIVFLRDANNEPWRDVLRGELARCRPDHQHLTVFGVCDRNVECWICADADWISRETGQPANEFRAADPKDVLESALGISRDDRKEQAIADLVSRAPLRNWLVNSSFEAFYDEVRRLGVARDCPVENVRDNP